jgi:hypothetical protein
MYKDSNSFYYNVQGNIHLARTKHQTTIIYKTAPESSNRNSQTPYLKYSHTTLFSVQTSCHPRKG